MFVDNSGILSKGKPDGGYGKGIGQCGVVGFKHVFISIGIINA